MFPKIVVPQNGWFIRGNPIKMDDLGVPLFLETPICTLVLFTTHGFCVGEFVGRKKKTIFGFIFSKGLSYV